MINLTVEDMITEFIRAFDFKIVEYEGKKFYARDTRQKNGVWVVDLYVSNNDDDQAIIAVCADVYAS